MKERVVRDRQHDSHASLARSIAREVQARLPSQESGTELMRFVEEALHAEARSIELTLAYLRVAALSVTCAVALAGAVESSLIGAEVPALVALSLVVALGAAVGFVLALRRGWYQARLRRFVPIADALLVLALVLLYAGGATPDTRNALAVGSAAASACAFLVLSGSARLSDTSQRIATTLGVGAWIVVGVVLGMPPVLIAAVAGFLAMLGAMGTRFATTVRGLVATQVRGERLGGLYDDARAAINAREEVLQMVAHDLRNPLSTITMTADLLRDLPSDDETRARHVSIINRASLSMNRLIHDLLDVARLEAGRMHVELKAVAARDLLDRAEELMTPIAERANVRLRIAADGELPAVLVDEERILQVLSNLVGNAVKFTPADGAVTIKARRILQTVRFGVLDTGPGIPPERAARIFDRFWQADVNDRRGIGLGLAIARSIVEAHGHRIGVDVPSTGGSEFWFTVTVAAEAER